MACFRGEAEGIVVTVRLTLRANRDSVDGIGVLADGSEVLLARVRAAPESGGANAALLKLMAETFGRPKSAATLARGATQRIKQVRISGEVAALAAIARS